MFTAKTVFNTYTLVTLKGDFFHDKPKLYLRG